MSMPEMGMSLKSNQRRHVKSVQIPDTHVMKSTLPFLGVNKSESLRARQKLCFTTPK